MEANGFRISVVCKDCTSTNVSLEVNQFYEITVVCNKCGQTQKMRK